MNLCATTSIPGLQRALDPLETGIKLLVDYLIQVLGKTEPL